MHHSTQRSVACEESTLKVRKRCLSHAEGSTCGGEVCGLLTSFVRNVLFVALEGENSPACRPCGASRMRTHSINTRPVAGLVTEFMLVTAIGDLYSVFPDLCSVTGRESVGDTDITLSPAARSATQTAIPAAVMPKREC
eukprot:254332-Pleurochrysis_carterae.AAC.1